MVSSDVKWPKTLESENECQKKLVAERNFEDEVMMEISAKSGERTGSPGTELFCNNARAQRAASVALPLLQVGRCCINYEAKMPAENNPVIVAMRKLAGQYPRFWSRRIHRGDGAPGERGGQGSM